MALAPMLKTLVFQPLQNRRDAMGFVQARQFAWQDHIVARPVEWEGQSVHVLTLSKDSQQGWLLLPLEAWSPLEARLDAVAEYYVRMAWLGTTVEEAEAMRRKDKGDRPDKAEEPSHDG
jgi:hypothetical protein